MSGKDADAAEAEYVLGTHDEEIVRLGFQHQLWSAQAMSAWERAGFKPGDTLLDVGCGPGYASFDLARLVGAGGRVIALDASPRFVGHFQSQMRARGVSNIDVRVGDAEALEVAQSSVDGAYARWVLCFVGDPAAVIRGVARALKPGAAFVVQDYFNYEGVVVAPPHEIFTRVFSAVSASFRARGGDADVGSRLPGMMEDCGLEVREINPLVRIARAGSPLWYWPEAFLNNYLPSMVENGFITQDERETCEREWLASAANAAAFFATPPVIEIISVKR